MGPAYWIPLSLPLFCSDAFLEQVRGELSAECCSAEPEAAGREAKQQLLLQHLESAEALHMGS